MSSRILSRSKTLPPDERAHAGDFLPDVLATGLHAIFCGINPGLQAATAGHHFAGRGNRFWSTMQLAGFTPRRLAPEEDREILRFGYGLTTAAPRPTVSADGLAKGEILKAADALAEKMTRYAPRYIAFLGKQAYAEILGQAKLSWGKQEGRFGGAGVWILPNPSGLNRSFTLERLVEHYRAFRIEIEAEVGVRR
jgi:double-stranded uracil-DNA glycosylase